MPARREMVLTVGLFLLEAFIGARALERGSSRPSNQPLRSPGGASNAGTYGVMSRIGEPSRHVPLMTSVALNHRDLIATPASAKDLVSAG